MLGFGKRLIFLFLVFTKSIKIISTPLSTFYRWFKKLSQNLKKKELLLFLEFD